MGESKDCATPAMAIDGVLGTQAPSGNLMRIRPPAPISVFTAKLKL